MKTTMADWQIARKLGWRRLGEIGTAEGNSRRAIVRLARRALEAGIRRGYATREDALEAGRVFGIMDPHAIRDGDGWVVG